MPGDSQDAHVESTGALSLIRDRLQQGAASRPAMGPPISREFLKKIPSRSTVRRSANSLTPESIWDMWLWSARVGAARSRRSESSFKRELFGSR